MNIDKEFPSKWLKAHDLDGDTPLTISNVTREKFQDGDSTVAVHFQGLQQMLGLNKTNANVIKGLYGADTDAWLGKMVVLYPTHTEMAGKTMPCVRIRPEAVAVPDTPAPANTATVTGDDIPF